MTNRNDLRILAGAVSQTGLLTKILLQELSMHNAVGETIQNIKLCCDRLGMIVQNIVNNSYQKLDEKSVNDHYKLFIRDWKCVFDDLIDLIETLSNEHREDIKHTVELLNAEYKKLQIGIERFGLSKEAGDVIPEKINPDRVSE